MPNLIDTPFWRCDRLTERVVQSDSDPAKRYNVTLRATGQYHCTCPAFSYGRGRECKHILAVLDSGAFCGWSQLLDGGDARWVETDEPVCPNCGGPLVAFRAAV